MPGERLKDNIELPEICLLKFRPARTNYPSRNPIPASCPFKHQEGSVRASQITEPGTTDIHMLPCAPGSLLGAGRRCDTRE